VTKKYLKYIIPIASIVVILIISIILFFSIPRLSYTYSDEYEGYLVKHAYANAKEYTIKEEHKGLPVVGIDERAFFGHSRLKEISLPSTIRIINRLAFSECDKLESINLENVDVIYRNAFAYCTSLNNLTIGAKSIGASAFYKCEALNDLELLDGAYELGSMAFSHTAIKDISIPRSMMYVESDCFYGCEKLTNINVYGSRLKYNEYLRTLDIVTYIG